MRISKKITSMTGMMIIVSAMILTGCGQKSPSSGPKSEVPEVIVVTMKTQPVVLTTELPGRISANLMAEVRPQVSGIIQKRMFTEGSDVKAGQLLFQIDPAPFQAALENALAGLSRAEANLAAIRLRAERLRELVADKAVSQQDYDDGAAALRQTEADIRYWKATVETARINLAYTSVTAPISGRIGRSNVTEGTLATAQQSTVLATIQRLDPVFVDVTQSTAAVLRLQRRLDEGKIHRHDMNVNDVQLILEDRTKYPLEGTLKFRDVSVDPTTGSVILRMVFPNPKGVLLPGMFVRAVLKEGVNKQAILVPQQAVSRDPKGDTLAMVVDSTGKVQQRMLTIDRAIGNQWLVATGLAAKDRVIVEGLQKVKPGVSVKTLPFESGGVPNHDESKKAAPPAVKVR